MSRILKFELNQPVTIALSTLSTMDVVSDYGKPQVLFALADGKRLFATPELAAKIRQLGLQPLESFAVRKWKKGRNVYYDVWLVPASEKARAVEEAPAIAAELAQPANLLQMPAPVEELPATGTEGRPAPARRFAIQPPPRSNVIPFNIAFREVTRFVAAELQATGEQWNDEARQGMVSTVLIAAAKNGWVGPWERGE